MKKKKEEKKVKPAQRPKLPTPVVEEDRENPFDFGGLPQRDLKKNLGCG